MRDAERGEQQQAKYLRMALAKLASAIQCHEAGMMDPAFADVDTAAGHLESYRRGPLKKNENTENDE